MVFIPCICRQTTFQGTYRIELLEKLSGVSVITAVILHFWHCLPGLSIQLGALTSDRLAPGQWTAPLDLVQQEHFLKQRKQLISAGTQTHQRQRGHLGHQAAASNRLIGQLGRVHLGEGQATPFAAFVLPQC